MKLITNQWSNPAVIARNNFKYKSLSCWSLNAVVGCRTGCRFCYVPDVSTNKLAAKLATLGVDDPDAQWGEYVFPRRWDEQAFLHSLQAAQKIPVEKLNADGNRAIMLATTTDDFQVTGDAKTNDAIHRNTRRALELILEKSDLNVRILTRWPTATGYFDLFKQFGKRLMFGMSLPTMDGKMSKVYEPNAPHPLQRLKTLCAARDAGLNVFVAMAPTFAECTEGDMRETLLTIRDLNPLTVFHEPINIRAENVERIEANAKEHQFEMNSAVFKSSESHRRYAIQQLLTVERLAQEIGITCLHLWPDKELGTMTALKQWQEAGFSDLDRRAWIHKYWSRISEWPT